VSAERHAPRPPPCLREPAGRNALAASSALHAWPARVDETAAPEVRPLARLCATCRHGSVAIIKRHRLFVAQCDDINFRKAPDSRPAVARIRHARDTQVQALAACDRYGADARFRSYRPRGGLSRSMPTTSGTESSRMPLRLAELVTDRDSFE
jgi:hypothetical protein